MFVLSCCAPANCFRCTPTLAPLRCCGFPPPPRLRVKARSSFGKAQSAGPDSRPSLSAAAAEEQGGTSQRRIHTVVAKYDPRQRRCCKVHVDFAQTKSQTKTQPQPQPERSRSNHHGNDSEFKSESESESESESSGSAKVGEVSDHEVTF